MKKDFIIFIVACILLLYNSGCRRTEEKPDAASLAMELPACDYSQISGERLDFVPLWRGDYLNTEDTADLQLVFVSEALYEPSVCLISEYDQLSELLRVSLDKLSDRSSTFRDLYQTQLEALQAIGDRMDFKNYNMVLMAYDVDGIYTEPAFNDETYKLAYSSGLPAGALIKDGDTLKIAVVDDYTGTTYLNSITPTFSVGYVSKETSKQLSEIKNTERINCKVLPE